MYKPRNVIPLSSGRWRRAWCASAVKSLSSHHTLKSLVPTFCLVVVVIYGLADKLRNFVVGIFIPQYHYPYAVALCFAQVGSFVPGLFLQSLNKRNRSNTIICLQPAHVHFSLLIVEGIQYVKRVTTVHTTVDRCFVYLSPFHVS